MPPLSAIGGRKTSIRRLIRWPTYCHRLTAAANRSLRAEPRRCHQARIATKHLSGDITLEPGTYILDGGRINLGGNGSLVGAGLTIFVMGDAEFSVNGNEVLS